MYGTLLFPLIQLTFDKVNGLVLAIKVQSTKVLSIAYASSLCNKILYLSKN